MVHHVDSMWQTLGARISQNMGASACSANAATCLSMRMLIRCTSVWPTPSSLGWVWAKKIGRADLVALAPVTSSSCRGRKPHARECRRSGAPRTKNHS
eukprot:scaffold84404_cov121-Phaeocystis_antarctica.AAC.2